MEEKAELEEEEDKVEEGRRVWNKRWRVCSRWRRKRRRNTETS